MDDFSHNLTEDMYNNFDDIVFPIVIWYSNTYNRVTPLSNSAPAKTHLYKKCRKIDKPYGYAFIGVDGMECDAEAATSYVSL